MCCLSYAYLRRTRHDFSMFSIMMVVRGHSYHPRVLFERLGVRNVAVDHSSSTYIDAEISHVHVPSPDRYTNSLKCCQCCRYYYTDSFHYGRRHTYHQLENNTRSTADLAQPHCGNPFIRPCASCDGEIVLSFSVC